MPASKITIQRAILTLVAIIISLVVCDRLAKRLVIATSDSTGHFVFWKVDRQVVSDSDYISFAMTSRYINNGKPTRLTKRAGCRSGQRLTIVGKRFFCDGTSLGAAKSHSARGEAVKMFNYTGIVPDGKVFAAGNSIDSYDSRYYGFVDTKSIEFVSRAIF